MGCHSLAAERLRRSPGVPSAARSLESPPQETRALGCGAAKTARSTRLASWRTPRGTESTALTKLAAERMEPGSVLAWVAKRYGAGGVSGSGAASVPYVVPWASCPAPHGAVRHVEGCPNVYFRLRIEVRVNTAC